MTKNMAVCSAILLAACIAVSPIAAQGEQEKPAEPPQDM
jgi:hypothetical protein